MNINNGSKFINHLSHFFKSFNRNLYSNSEVQIFDLETTNRLAFINKIIVINLDRQKTRWRKLLKELKSHKAKHRKTLFDFLERVPAIDGKFIDPVEYSNEEVIGLYNLKEHFYVDPDPRLSHLVRNKDIRISMTASEIAVAHSHIKIWKKIVEEEIPATLILEDDVYFDRNFSLVSKKAWDEIPVDGKGNKKFDLLYFSYREVDNGAEKTQFSSSLSQPSRGYWWLSGYVLSFQGAKKLIDLIPVCGPIDMWINLQFHNLSVFSVINSIIHQRRDYKSDNSYSIMPILSRVGIHLEAKGRKSKSLIKRKPIFAIGLNKTGTTSLHFALTLLGYKCCHWISDDFSKETATLIDQKKPLPFDAYTDVKSITQNYMELDKQYPHAVFILTTRKLEDWISSRSRHVIRNRTENLKGAKHTWVDIDIETWVEEREK
ncbi:MAG: glycosyltransferase family 25 protein, partial [Cytophagales bacterium]